MNWKSRRNYKKSRKAPIIYAVVRYADWCVREYRFAGKFKWSTINDPVPLVYHYDDHNGERESWDVRPITHTTSASMPYWTFSRGKAEAIAYQMKILEKVNYGKAFDN